jgi:hypothetical protein
MATRGWDGITPADLERLLVDHGPAPRRKYRNVSVEVEGLRFDSRAEGEYWLTLRDREARGEIYDLRRQVAFPLFTVASRDQPPHRILVQVAEYRADFVYFEAGQRHVVDVKRKATQTQVYQLKRKWLQLQDGIVIEEVAA